MSMKAVRRLARGLAPGAAAAVAASIGACSGPAEPDRAAATSPGSPSPTTSASVATPSPGGPSTTKAGPADTGGLQFDPARFGSGVDNPYFPLRPGTRFTYRGVSDGEPETIVVRVTGQTRTILGIPAVVVRDTVHIGGELVEDTYDWFGTDDDGNVWYLGEDVKDYEGGKVTGTGGSWEAGRNGAEAGVQMMAPPEVGDRYQQEQAKGVAEDRARVVSTTERVAVPAGTFRDVVKIAETTPLEPDVLEYKYYARGIGLVLAIAAKGGPERAELVQVTKP
jgi:hypothetical protein